MKGLVFYGPEEVRYEDTTSSAIEAGHLRIDVDSCGICGTDMHIFKGLPSSWPTPGIRGHEISGTISEVGDDVTRYQVGDRVIVQPLIFCNDCPACDDGKQNLCYNTILVGGEIPGGFAENVVVPATAVMKIKDGTSLADAACVETLATPLHAFRTHVTRYPQSAVIFGAGPQGLFTLQLAKHFGIETVIMVDVIENRLEVAKKLGADYICNSLKNDPIELINEVTGGYGVPLGFDAAGIPITRQQLISSLSRGGMGIFIALGSAPTPVDFLTVGPKELKLCGTQCYTNSDMAEALSLIENGKIQLDDMVKVYPMSEGEAVFKQLSENPQDNIKVLLRNV